MEPQRQGKSGFDQRAREVSRGDFPVVVARTREILGPKLVVFIGHAIQAREIHAWIDGSVTLDPEVQRRLRAACYAAVLLNEREGEATVQSWFRGMVPELDDAPPAELLHDLALTDAVKRVERAARGFWVDG